VACAEHDRVIICGIVVGLLYLAFHLAHRADEARVDDQD
jgi:hypothetical protein